MVADPVSRRLLDVESQVLDRLDAAVMATGLDGTILYANRYCEVLYGRSPAELVGRRADEFTVDELTAELKTTIGKAILSGMSWEGDFRVRRANGSVAEVHAVDSPLFDESGGVVGVVTAAFDATEVRRREGRDRFMAEAATVLASSLDYPGIFERLARLSVPYLADLCLIDLADGRAVRRVAATHADPSKQFLVDELEARFQPDPIGEHPALRVIRGGHSEHSPEMTDDFLRATTRSEEHFQITKALDFASYMCVPLRARGQVIASFTLVSAGSGRSFDADDLALAEDFARRAALAVDNARLFSERSHVAEALQTSLLPPTLPEIPGVEVATRYIPAGEANEVGGDFYDVFELTGGRWAFVVGDVAGKGPEAGAVAGLARHTLRAGALREKRPSGFLHMLHDVLSRDDSTGQRFCTACIGILDRLTARASRRGRPRRVTLACGGHPLPLIVRRDGSVDTMQCKGTLLGAVPEVTFVDEGAGLETGDTLILYSDGITEAHDANLPLFGDERLVSLAGDHARASVHDLADAIVNAAVSYTSAPPRDDIALIVLRLVPHIRRRRLGGTYGPTRPRDGA